jgi:hypothetical protein
MLLLYGEDLVAFRPTTTLEDHPLSFVLAYLNAIISFYIIKSFVFLIDFLWAHSEVGTQYLNSCYLLRAWKTHVGKFFWKYFAFSLSLSSRNCPIFTLILVLFLLLEQAGEVWELVEHWIGSTFT